jgi:hypothetical protein
LKSESDGWEFTNTRGKVKKALSIEASALPSKDHLRPVDLRVTSRTESDHQMQQRLPRFPMMDSEIGITAHPTGVTRCHPLQGPHCGGSP